MKKFFMIVLLALIASPVLAAVPTAGTSEWHFDGTLDAVVGPGALEAQGGITDSFTTKDGIDCLQFNARASSDEGYMLRPLTGAANNSLLQFTMVFDLFIEADNNDSYLGLVNGAATNANDAELFLRPNTEGFYFGGTGSTGAGSWSKGQWNRFVYVCDYTNDQAAVYVNGSLVFAADPYDYIYDGQSQASWILTDNTASETSDGFIANFAVTDALLDANAVGALGGVSADGVFVPEPATMMLLSIGAIAAIRRKRA